eukprot:6462574-Pyramimonas_sp.AAC.1
MLTVSTRSMAVSHSVFDVATTLGALGSRSTEAPRSDLGKTWLPPSPSPSHWSARRRTGGSGSSRRRRLAPLGGAHLP